MHEFLKNALGYQRMLNSSKHSGYAKLVTLKANEGTVGFEKSIVTELPLGAIADYVHNLPKYPDWELPKRLFELKREL